jgi:phosphopentomutase
MRTPRVDRQRTRRVLVVVLDGLGCGAMDDAAPRDADAHTLRNIVRRVDGIRIPNLAGLGLGEVGRLRELGGQGAGAIRRGAWGLARLGYAGADTYLGHQAMMGAPLSTIELHMLADRTEAVIAALSAAGHRVERICPDASALLVDDVAVVADNIEAAPGLNINVTASVDEIPFDDLVAIGTAVRRVVQVPRVIVVGGRGYTTRDVVASLTVRGPGHVGVDTPGLGVYDSDYVVRHLGGAGAADGTLPSLVIQAGMQVILLGKAADVIECDGAARNNDIPTGRVLEGALTELDDDFEGLIVANVQETDLAGHEQDAARFAAVLEEVDAALPGLVDALGPEGCLFVAADHGNDPAAGHSQHTREHVPVLVAGAGVRDFDLGVLDSLADVGATIAEMLGVGAVREGRSFAKLCRGGDK